MSVNFELVIFCGRTAYTSDGVVSISWDTSRMGAPGRLELSVVDGAAIPLREGDRVRLSVGDRGVFYGYVFSLSRDVFGALNVVCYDQLRYLKNRDSYVFEMKTASDIVRNIAADHGLEVGVIEDTGYGIPSLVESGASMLDIIGDALDITLSNTGRRFVLYDDCGKIVLRSPENMRVEIILGDRSAERFELGSSIDSGVYNKVKIAGSRENSRDFSVACDGELIKKWGELQYYSASGKAADAASLLELYSSPKRSLEIVNAEGDPRVRGGSAVAVNVKFGTIDFRRFVRVERARHSIRGGRHTMSLSCSVGDIAL